MTAKPTFSRNISLGNWLTIVGLIVAAVTTWDQVSDLGKQNRSAIVVAENSRKAIELRVSALEGRARTLETEQARASERYNSIMQLLNRIDARTERLEREDK